MSHGYKGKGSLIHILVDGNGYPIAATTTSASGNERCEVEKLLDRIPAVPKQKLAGRMIVLEADKGYDCNWLRQVLLIRNIFPLIPYRKMSGRDIPKTEQILETFSLKKKRWQVERAISWFKRRCRRLLARWERTSLIWNGFVSLGLIYMWIKNLVG